MKRTEEIIRVRFLREGLAPSRPKRIRKVTFENGKVIYTSMIKGSNLEISPDLFITEWEKGETPQPKRRRDRLFNCKDVSRAFKYYSKLQKKEKKAVKITYKEIREMLENETLTMKEVRA